MSEVWLLWQLYYDEQTHDYSRLLVGVFATSEAADREQIAQNIAEFEIVRVEPIA